MASLSLYMSIWFGIVLVGVLMYPSHYQSSMDMIMNMATDPVDSFWLIMQTAFSSITGNWVLGALTLLAFGVGAYSSYQLGGGGFSILFAVPLLIIISVFTVFVLPITTVMSQTDMPLVLQYTFFGFLGLMTIMTGIQFTAGRS